MRKLKMILAIVSFLIAVVPAGARPPTTPGRTQIQQSGKQPIYTITINVVERTTKAVNYQHRNGSTTIDFRGTPLMPAARGEAKVESKQGYMEVEVEFDNLQSATRFGPEFLTYVMWSITPEGRARNMGEVILNGTKSKLDVTTELQAFGLVVTAEPYFGVTQPSDVVVLENFVRKDTVGKVEEIDAKYELLQRGQYTVNVLPADLKPIPLDKNTPLDLYEARNAVRIAKWAGADVSAAESFEKASKLLAQAELYKTRKAGSKPIAMAAREAVQTAEDARLITLKTQAEARLTEERSASANREATANATAARERTDANDARRDSAAAQAQSDRTKLEALAAQRTADDARAAQAETSRKDAELAAQRAARDKESVEAANQLARKSAADQSEREKEELRNQLVKQQADQTKLDALAAQRIADDARAAQAETSRKDAELAAQRAARDKESVEAANQLARKSAADQSEREKDELRAAAEAQADRTKSDALAAQRTADDARAAQAENSRKDAELAAQRAARDKESVEAANQLARKSAADQSEREKQELRNQLVLQLNTILQTRDTARGLIVNLSDVIFDTGRYSLKPGAREKLAKISGIVLAHPTLRLGVEGHTDSVGADNLNMTLSENRANSVRDFLVHEGIVSTSITSRGFGESQPVATNDTPAGRQQNRRVELVVSGDVIGSPVRSAGAAK